MTNSKARISIKAMLILGLASAPIILTGCPSEPCHGTGCNGNSGSDASIHSDPSSPEHYATTVTCDPTYTDLKILFQPAQRDTYDGMVHFSPTGGPYHKTDEFKAWWEFCNYTCNKDYDGSHPPMSVTFTVTSKSGTSVPSPVTMNIPALTSGHCDHQEVQLQDGQSLQLDPGEYTCTLSGVLTSTQPLAIIQ
jgi:hypothetical protein